MMIPFQQIAILKILYDRYLIFTVLVTESTAEKKQDIENNTLEEEK